MTIDKKFNSFLITIPTYSRFLDVGGPSQKFLQKIINIYNTPDYYALNVSTKRGAKDVRNFIQGSVCDIPIKEGFFDVVFSFNVFEHINEPWRAAEECVRVTKKGGLLIHNTTFSWRHHDPPDYYRYSHQGLAYLFERTNKVERIISEMGEFKKRKQREKWDELWKTIYIGRKKY